VIKKDKACLMLLPIGHSLKQFRFFQICSFICKSKASPKNVGGDIAATLSAKSPVSSGERLYRISGEGLVGWNLLIPANQAIRISGWVRP
jgi:hypothetical protein